MPSVIGDSSYPRPSVLMPTMLTCGQLWCLCLWVWDKSIVFSWSWSYRICQMWLC